MSGTPEALMAALMSAFRLGLDEGAAALWEAMSDRARAPMVDLDGAKRALSNELLAPLIGHHEHLIEPLQVLGEVARAEVRVESARGTATYLMSLRRIDSGWRITGLRREDLPYS